MRLFNLQRIEAIITDALWTRTASVFAKCQRGMTVTLLLAQAQDVAAEERERGANTVQRVSKGALTLQSYLRVALALELANTY